MKSAHATKESYKLHILLILLFSLTVLNWFKGDFFIFGGDYVPIFHPVEEFIEDSYIWLSHSGSQLALGHAGRHIAEIFPYEFLTAIGSIVGFSPIQLQKGVFYLIMVVSGLSMYLLTVAIFANRHGDMKIAGLFAALCYMFNTYTMFFKWPDRVQSLFAYMLAPTVLCLYMKGLEQNKPIYSIGLAMTFLFMSPAATTPTYLVLVVLICVAYLLFYNCCDADLVSAKTSLAFSGGTIMLIILINAWWILPYIANIYETGGKELQVAKSFASFKSTMAINSQDTSFVNIFRLMGYWALDGEYGNDYYYPLLSKFYKMWFVVIISTFVPIIAFGSTLVKGLEEKYRKLVLFFCGVSLISLFLIKGGHDPLGELNEWLFFHLPGFACFRSQYEKVGQILVLVYSALFGFVVSRIYLWVKRVTDEKFGWGFLGAVFLCFFVINVFPFWVGSNVQGRRGALPPQRIRIPVRYNDAHGWLKRMSDCYRLVIFPLSTEESGDVNFEWGGTNGNVLAKLLDQPVVTKIPFGEGRDVSCNAEYVVGLAGILNVGFIIMDSSRLGVYDECKVLDEGDRSVIGWSVRVRKKFGELEIGMISREYLLPRIYASMCD